MIIHYASIIASALLCFSAVPGVLARPLDDSNSVARRATKPKPWDMSNKTLVCGAKFSDTDKKVNEDIWYQSGSGIYLDVFIKPETYHGWVKNFDMMTWNKANSDWDCTATSSVCGVPGDCDTMYDVAGKHGQNYFILYSVSKAHQVFKYFKEQMMQTTITNLLSFSTLTSEFDANPSGINPFGIAAGSFGMAAGLLGSVPGYGGIAAALPGIAGGAFGIAGATYQPSDANAMLETLLGEYWNNTVTSIDQTVRNLFGGQGGDADKLPPQALTGGWVNSIASFFDGGKFLITDVDAVYRPMIDEGNKFLRQSLIIRLLKFKGWHIHINTLLKNQEDCEISLGERVPSAQWRHDLNMCFRIVGKPYQSKRSGTDRGKIPWTRDNLPEDKFKLLTEKYFTNITEIYENSLDCSKNRGPGDRNVDAATVPYNGRMPTCFFNLDVFKGEFDLNSGDYIRTQPL